jgi:hypothetical protein
MPQIIAPQEDQYDEFGRPLSRPLYPQYQQPMFAPPPSENMGQGPTIASIPPGYNPRPAIVPDRPTQGESMPIQMPNYQDPQFRNSRLRTVLNAIAGGLAGAAGGPIAGMKVGEGLRDVKYNRAMQDYDNQVGEQKRVLEIEKGQYGRSEKAQQLKTAETVGESKLLSAENARIAAEERNARLEKEANTHKQRADTYENNSKALTKERDALADKHKLQAQQIEELNKIMVMPFGPERDKKVTEYNKLFKPKESGDEKAETAGKVREAQLKKEAQFGGPAAKAKTTATLEAKAAAPISDDDQAALDLHVQRSIDNPDSIQDIVKQIPRNLQSRYWSRLSDLDVKIPKVLTPKLQETVTSAKTAINHANTIRDLIKDPDMQKALGPIAGRLTEGGNIVGKSVYNTGPAAQKEAQLLGMLRYLITFEASSTSGTRPSWQLIQFLKGTSPGMRMDDSKFQGALDAVITSAGNRLAGIYSPTSSGKAEDKPKLLFEEVKKD